MLELGFEEIDEGQAPALVGAALAGPICASDDTQDRAGRDRHSTNATHGGIGRCALPRDPNTECDFVRQPPTCGTRQTVERKTQRRREATLDWLGPRTNTRAEEPGVIESGTGACAPEVRSEALTVDAPSQSGEKSHGQERDAGSAHGGRLTHRG